MRDDDQVEDYSVDAVVEQVLKQPDLLQEILAEHFGAIHYAADEAEIEIMQDRITSCEDEQRKMIDDEVRSWIQRAIRRGEAHRFSGFLDNDKS
jgi:hypothetical protein